WLDNSLLLLLCTPNMHRVHHHYRQPYSDSNYGNIFPFWDKLFGTYLVIDNKKLVYGVDTHMDVKEVNEISNLLKIPFQPYRPPIKYDTEEKL
ncbi:MAG: sterol desaturase/sphingolipid hydroxylase (fatty acid hydroxylase superfamily), partial [Flavobacteriales bacterium]